MGHFFSSSHYGLFLAIVLNKVLTVCFELPCSVAAPNQTLPIAVSFLWRSRRCTADGLEHVAKLTASRYYRISCSPILIASSTKYKGGLTVTTTRMWWVRGVKASLINLQYQVFSQLFVCRGGGCRPFHTDTSCNGRFAHCRNTFSLSLSNGC